MPPRPRIEPLALAVIVGAAGVGPFWQTYSTQSLAGVTLGRAALLALALATAVLLFRRAPRGAPPPGLILFLAGLGGLWVVMTLSAATRGCFCAGSWYGYTELASLAALLAICAAVAPRLRMPLLLAALVGSTVCALLGLLSIVDIRQSAVPPMPFAGRIGGPFGNPNYLGFSIAVGVPIAAVLLIRGNKRQRAVAVLGLAAMTLAVAMTYSRGAILASAAGTLVAVALLPARRRRQFTVLVGGAAAAALAAVLGYSSFDQARTNADLSAVRPAAAARDRSGWDGNARGLISAGPATLRNPAPGVLMASTGTAGRGLSLDLGRVPRGAFRRVSFEVRSSARHVPIGFALEDDRLGLSPSVGHATVSARWRRFSLAWTPSQDATAARFYLWQAAAAPDLEIRRLTIRTPAQLRAANLTLQGPVVRLDAAASARIERRYIDARLSVARLAIDAFKSAPLVGIGWQRFAGYASARAPLGSMATHDEYLRIAAELGIAGIVPFLLVVFAVGAGARSAIRRGVDAAVVGGIVTAGVGLLFVNGLVTPAASTALAVVAALAAASTPWSAGAGSHST